MTDARIAYFTADGDDFAPTDAARSPWDPAFMSGVALAGLIAFVTERAIEGEALTLARLTIDILGVAPRRRTAARVVTRRGGARLRLLEIELIVGDRSVARASALLVRVAESPPADAPLAWPLPETIDKVAPSTNPYVRSAIERRIVFGAPSEAGPGAMWVRLGLDMVAGVPISPLCRAAMMGDMGSAIGSSLDVRAWTFANVDISLHFSRPPRGEWLLIEALSESAGNGLSMVATTFADRDGIYARGHQALFVEPRSR